MKLCVGLCLLVGVAGCSVESAPGEPPGRAIDGAEGRVSFELTPDGAVHEGPNDFTLRVSRISDVAPVDAAALSPRAFMPSMGHQTDEPSVDEIAAGSYAIRGVVFDMPGSWALHVRVDKEGLSDETEFDFDVP